MRLYNLRIMIMNKREILFLQNVWPSKFNMYNVVEGTPA